MGLEKVSLMLGLADSVSLSGAGVTSTRRGAMKINTIARPNTIPNAPHNGAGMLRRLTNIMGDYNPCMGMEDFQEAAILQPSRSFRS